MNISYKLAIAEDIDDLARFWSENSGWDIIDRAEWKKRFINTPFGDSIVALAIDDQTKKIIGQFIFIPSRIIVSGKEVKAYRPFAPILHQSLQTKFGIASLFTGNHPLLMLYKKASETVTKLDASLLYMLPDPRWSRVLQAFPFIKTHKFPLWCHSLPLNKNYEIPASVTIEKINPDNPKIDTLWQQAALVYPSSVIRNSKILAWRAIQNDLMVFGVTDHCEMIGLFAIGYKKNDYQWLVCDMLTKDKNESLNITLMAICNTIDRENNILETNSDHKRKIAILAIPVIEKAAAKLGFEKNAYQFTLALDLLNIDGVDKKSISPSNWYVSAND